MFNTVVLLLCVSCMEFAWGQENIGDACEVEEADDTPGICKEDYLCEYSDRRINEEKKEITYCFIRDGVTAVCCPTELRNTGIFGRAFMESQDGKLTSDDIVCRYTGQLPLICCKVPPQSTSITIQKRFFDICGVSSGTAACRACHEFSNPNEYTEICPKTTEVRIWEGESTSIEELPHMVVLGCRNRNKETKEDPDVVWVGGGTLISAKFVLTAAHVLHEPKYGKLEYALLGTVNKSDIRSGIFRNIVTLKQHKLYDSSTHLNDIALVELDFPVTITQFTRPACLPVPGLIPDVIPKAVKIAGWGQTGQHMNTSRLLKKGVTSILTESICRTEMRKQNREWDVKSMICASSNEADACSGDSGGPLMATFNAKILNVCGYYVVGIVSWGAVCGPNKVGVYTNVVNNEYLKWISETVWPNE